MSELLHKIEAGFVVPKVCVCAKWWYMQGAAPIQCNTWWIPPNKCLLLKMQRCIFKKASFLVLIVSFHAAFGSNKWHKIFMFRGSSGRKLRTWNVLSAFIMCRLFYWCALFCRQTGSTAATVVMVKPGDGGINHLFDVSWWKRIYNPVGSFGVQTAVDL